MEQRSGKQQTIKAFKLFARLKGKSTVFFDKTTMDFIPGSWRLQFLRGGKVRVVEIINTDGKFRSVTSDLTKKVFIELAKELKGFIKEIQ